MNTLKKALLVHNPIAESISKGVCSVVILNKGTKYRGEVLVCSTTKQVYGLEDSQLLAKANLVEVKQVSEFTNSDWYAANMKADESKQNKFGYFLKDVVRVVEMPIRSSKTEKLSRLDIDEDFINEYPRFLLVDLEGCRKAISNSKQEKLCSVPAQNQHHSQQSPYLSALKALGRLRRLFFKDSKKQTEI